VNRGGALLWGLLLAGLQACSSLGLLFQTLLSVQLSGDEAASRGPVLTVPVN
jgi:hypothetical protein